MPQFESLRILEAACWQELCRASTAREHGWHTMVLATLDDAEPDARTVVLRSADRARGELLFYSDARAHKIDQIRRYPKGCLVAWSEALQWQLRFRVDLQVKCNERDARSRRALLRMSQAPSDFLADLHEAHGQLPLEPSRAPPEHFALVVAKVRRMEWLELNGERHRAAVLSERGAQWVCA